MSDRYASLKQGLVGCWIPSVSGSGLLLPDLSGRGNNGSLVGMDASDWVSASYGRALDFDGVDDTVIANLSPAITLGKNATISAWAKTTTTSGNQPVFSVGGRFTGFINLTLRGIPPLSAIFELWDLTNNPNIIISVNANQWYHLAGVFQEGVMTFYIDGKVAGTLNNATTQATSIPSQIVARIGNNTDYNLWLIGQADDARVYNRALSASEIRLLASEPGIGFKRNTSAFATRYAYKPAKPRNYSVIRNRDPNYSTLRQGLVAAYCPSISGQGNVLPDLVGGNHGTLTNMTADDWVSSGDGRALDFDGTDDVVSISGSVVYAQNGQPFTASIHAYVRNFTNPYTKFLMLRSDCASNNAWEFGVSDQGPYLGILIGTNGSYARIKTDTLAATITSGWHHYLVVYNGGDRSQSTSFRIYFDGTLQVNSGAGSFSPTTNTSSISLNGNNNRLNGVADDVRIYNRALSESEIKLLASKRGIGLQPRNTHVTFADLGVQKTYSVVRVKETDYATLRQGLVGAWCPSLPNGGSGNTLPDVSGYNNHGTLTNMGPDDWVSGQYGRALEFDGSNDYVDVGTATVLRLENTSWSISFWVKPQLLSKFQVFVANDSNVTQNPLFEFGIANNNRFYYFDGTLNPQGDVMASDWQHCIATATLTSASFFTLRLYQNAVLTSTQTGVSVFTSSRGQRLRIGVDAESGAGQSAYLTGQMDDVRFYNRALTEAEIRLLASRPGIGLRQESHRNTFYQFPSGSRRKRILTGMP